MGYWSGKVVVVTGGSAGFGRILAQTYAERGAKVVVAARNFEKLRRVAEELSSLGDVTAVPADVTDSAQVTELFTRTIDRHGRLDCLVNNAGRSTRGEALDATPEEFSAFWETNFLSGVRCAQAAAPHLIASKGHLVNIGSLAGKTVLRYLGAYPASKFAVSAYSQQLRYELGPQGVHVLLVCSGPIRRDDAGRRYDGQTDGLPDSARHPGGGVKIAGIDPHSLAAKILRACERRRAELVVPWQARLLLAVSQLSPALGDWIIGRVS